MDVANITTLITALRNETEKQSISPENVGYLLQIIVDFCNEQDLSLSETVETLAVKLDSRVAILESKDSEQDSDILQIRGDVDSLSENLKAHDTTLTNHSQSIAMNTEAITNLNALVESAQETAERAGASAEANKSQIDTLQTSTESHGSDITQLQVAMVSHSQAIDALAAKNDEQDASLTAQYSTLETHIRDFEEDIVGAKFNDAKGTLFERVIALEAENGTLKSQVESLQRLTDGYDIRFEEMQVQIDSLMQNNQ